MFALQNNPLNERERVTLLGMLVRIIMLDVNAFQLHFPALKYKGGMFVVV